MYSVMTVPSSVLGGLGIRLCAGTRLIHGCTQNHKIKSKGSKETN